MTIGPCTPSAIVTGVVGFDPAAFKTAFPAFAGLADGVLVANFAFATLQLNNSCGSAVKDANVRQALLNLLVAHITQLLNGTNDGAGNVTPPAQVVGRVSQAKEGSVDVSVELMGVKKLSQAYYVQTQYGFQYWQSTILFRTAFYVPPCNRNYTPGYYGRG